MTSLKLMCFYTSGMKPFSGSEGLPNHDDWGLKYIDLSEKSPIIKWQKACGNLYMEAKKFLKEEAEGVFVRNWEENSHQYLGLAISSRESKGSMRRNALVAIFIIDADITPQQVIGQITFNEKYLPHGLKEIKKNLDVIIAISSEKKLSCASLVKLGAPLEMQKKDESRTTTTYMPVLQTKRSIFPWIIAAIMTMVAIASVMRDEVAIQSTSMTTLQPRFFKKEMQHNEDLERENNELRQKVDNARGKLREKMYELEEKDTIATEIGGWESLKVLIHITKKYQIDRAEKLQIVLERYKQDIEELKKQRKNAQKAQNNEKDITKNIKFELKNLLEYLENIEFANDLGDKELQLNSVKWRYIKKKLLYLID